MTEDSRTEPLKIQAIIENNQTYYIQYEKDSPRPILWIDYAERKEGECGTKGTTPSIYETLKICFDTDQILEITRYSNGKIKKSPEKDSSNGQEIKERIENIKPECLEIILQSLTSEAKDLFNLSLKS